MERESERKRKRERERDSRAGCVRAYYAWALPSRVYVCHTRIEQEKRASKRETERDKSVGGSVANHFLPGRVRSSNNRILVRAVSEKGCTPLYVRLERTATEKEEREREREATGKRKKKEKRKRRERTEELLDARITLLCTLFIKRPAVSWPLLRMK